MVKADAAFSASTLLMDSVVTGTYIVSFMQLAGIPLVAAGTIIFISRIGDVLGVLLSGPLADLCRRRIVTYFAIGLTTILSYPFVLAIIGRRILLAMIMQGFMVLFGLGLLHGLAPILTSESFPTKFRYSGSGISFNLAGILGGMVAPLLLARSVLLGTTYRWSTSFTARHPCWHSSSSGKLAN
jgi:MFS family permease